jgi:hypothetical protein
MDAINKLVNSGRVSPHHVLPQSGWVSFWIKGEKMFPQLLIYLKCDMIILGQNNMHDNASPFCCAIASLTYY